MRNLTAEDVLKWDARLAAVPQKEWSKLWNALNDHMWPEELGEPPEDFEIENNVCCSVHPVVAYLMQSIEISCGKKSCLRYFHKTELGKTDQEFDDWWESMIKKELEEEFRKGNQNGNYRQGYGNRIEDYCLTISSFTLGFTLCILLIALIRFFAK